MVWLNQRDKIQALFFWPIQCSYRCFKIMFTYMQKVRQKQRIIPKAYLSRIAQRKRSWASNVYYPNLNRVCITQGRKNKYFSIGIFYILQPIMLIIRFVQQNIAWDVQAAFVFVRGNANEGYLKRVNDGKMLIAVKSSV